MAESGFQHHRFLQTVGRGRLSADINWQSFICPPWKSYSISPGRASHLSDPGDSCPGQCHWVSQLKDTPAGSQSSPGTQPASCCALDARSTPCLSLGGNWAVPSSARHQEGPLELHTSLAAPSTVGSLPGHPGLSLDCRSQQHHLILICKTPQKHLQGNQDLPLYSCELYPFDFYLQEAVSSNLNMINSKGINVQHTKSLKYEPSCFGEKQNSRPFCFLFLPLQ